jgi:hypothetical protein
MKTHNIELIGVTPLLMHSDDIRWADKMTAWKDDSRNKKLSRAGDDRTPSFRWIGHAYSDGTYLAMPTENIMVALRDGGAMVPVPGGRSGKTFKAQTQSGMMADQPFWDLTVGGRQVAMADILPLMNEPDFAVHEAAATKLGFELFIKRARVGTQKHIRVRPRFDNWRLTGSLTVTDPQITPAVLNDILGYAGRLKGLGDWRPGGKTPGAFGMFTASVS